MANKLIELKEAAAMLGVSADELNDMRSRSEIFGYRDGPTWKFKMSEVERVASKLGVDLTKATDQPAMDSGSGIDDDLSELFDVAEISEEEGSDSPATDEVALGHPDEDSSSTVIGKSDVGGESSLDLDLQDSDIASSEISDVSLVAESGVGSDVRLVPGSSDILSSAAEGSDVLSRVEKEEPIDGSDTADLSEEGSGVSGFDADELALPGEDLSLGEDADLELESHGGSTADLADSDLELEPKGGSTASLEEGSELSLGGSDTDLVLDSDIGLGSGIGSDVTQSVGDSGISLGSPSQSGLSLDEEPLDLGGSAVDSFELGEDDMIPLDEGAADPDAATQLRADDDFLLTGIDDLGGDESDSGSQVIALDTEEIDAPLLGAQAAPFLEDEAALLAVDAGAGLGPAPVGAGMQPLVSQAAVPEVPYTVWNVLGLMFVVLVLALTGMVMFELIQNMWSWNGPHPINSGLIEKILEMVG